MAKLHKAGTTMVVTVRDTKTGGVIWVLRSDAHILKRNHSGRHSDAGRVKPGMTVEQITAILERKYPDATVSATMPPSHVPNDPETHARLTAARQARAAKAATRDALERSREAGLQLGSDETEPPFESTVEYVTALLRMGGSAHDGRLRYVRDMARFHGGATGGNLGTAIMADMCLPRGYAHKPALDAMADEVAKRVFGSDMHAARRWARALG